jgi:hypothetical protein
MSSSSTTLVRWENLVDQAGPHARHLVGGNARTHAATADGHAAVHLAASNCTGQGHNKIRIVIIRLRLAVAEVGYSIVSLTQHRAQVLLQLKTSMIRADTDAFRRPWQHCRRIGHCLLQQG